MAEQRLTAGLKFPKRKLLWQETERQLQLVNFPPRCVDRRLYQRCVIER